MEAEKITEFAGTGPIFGLFQADINKMIERIGRIGDERAEVDYVLAASAAFVAERTAFASTAAVAQETAEKVLEVNSEDEFPLNSIVKSTDIAYTTKPELLYQSPNDKAYFILQAWSKNVTIHFGNAADFIPAAAHFLIRVRNAGILKSQESYRTFIRACLNRIADEFNSNKEVEDGLQKAVGTKGHHGSTQESSYQCAKTKCFESADNLASIMGLLVRNVQGSVQATMLKELLDVICATLLDKNDEKKQAFRTLPYHRLIHMLFLELTQWESFYKRLSMEVLLGFSGLYYKIKPSRAPGFIFSWIELIGDETFISNMLGIMSEQVPYRNIYFQLFAELLRHCYPSLPGLDQPEKYKSFRRLHRISLSILTFISCKFPEFLIAYGSRMIKLVPRTSAEIRKILIPKLLKGFEYSEFPPLSSDVKKSDVFAKRCVNFQESSEPSVPGSSSAMMQPIVSGTKKSPAPKLLSAKVSVNPSTGVVSSPSSVCADPRYMETMESQLLEPSVGIRYPNESMETMESQRLQPSVDIRYPNESKETMESQILQPSVVIHYPNESMETMESQILEPIQRPAGSKPYDPSRGWDKLWEAMNKALDDIAVQKNDISYNFAKPNRE